MDAEQIRRKITALENQQRVSIANTSIEAKTLLLKEKEPSDDLNAVLTVIKEIQFIMTSTTSSWTLLHHVEEIQDELFKKIDELTEKVNNLDGKADRVITFNKDITVDTSKVNTVLFGPLTSPLTLKGVWEYYAQGQQHGMWVHYDIDLDYHELEESYLKDIPKQMKAIVEQLWIYYADMEDLYIEVFKIANYGGEPYLHFVQF